MALCQCLVNGALCLHISSLVCFSVLHISVFVCLSVCLQNGGEGFSELVDSVKVAKVRMKKVGQDTAGAVESGGSSTAEQRHTLQSRINLYNQRQTPAHQLKFVSSGKQFVWGGAVICEGWGSGM